MQNSAFRRLAISPSDAPRLVEEFSKLKDIGKRVDAGLEGDIDKHLSALWYNVSKIYRKTRSKCTKITSITSIRTRQIKSF